MGSNYCENLNVVKMKSRLTDEVVSDPGEFHTLFEVLVPQHLPATCILPRVHHLSNGSPCNRMKSDNYNLAVFSYLQMSLDIRGETGHILGWRPVVDPGFLKAGGGGAPILSVF